MAASAYCGAVHPDGWRCVLAAGPHDEHLSIDNRGLWHGTPGIPVRWPAETQAVTPRRALPGFTGVPCDRCGSPNTVRTGTCLTCQDCGHGGSCG